MHIRNENDSYLTMTIYVYTGKMA